ncbi:hypothetical protein DMJ13_21670 [halophilic archaeon]|nr:hypothetical protein DMJ13_21670 [halophilic archaeon]
MLVHSNIVVIRHLLGFEHQGPDSPMRCMAFEKRIHGDSLVAVYMQTLPLQEIILLLKISITIITQAVI